MSLLTFSIAIWYIVIYLDFGWLIPDQIQMYPDWYTIFNSMILFKGKSKYITKHLMYGPSGN